MHSADYTDDDFRLNIRLTEFWDAGREAIVGAWVDSTGKIAEIVDETTREAESELALEDDFLLAF